METTYDAPEDDPTTGAILEICEIEVYGNKHFKIDNQWPKNDLKPHITVAGAILEVCEIKCNGMHFLYFIKLIFAKFTYYHCIFILKKNQLQS